MSRVEAPRPPGPSVGAGWRAAGVVAVLALAAAFAPLAAQEPVGAAGGASDPSRITWRLGLARGAYPFPLDTIWRAGPVVSLAAEVPLRSGFVEFGVAGSSLTAVDPAPFDPADVVGHPPDVLLLRPFSGLGWTRTEGAVRPRASLRLGVDIVRIVAEGYESSDPNEMEWNAGVAGGVAWWPDPRWSLGVDAGVRRVFNLEADWFWDVGASVGARAALPGPLGALLDPPPPGGSRNGDPAPALPEGCRAPSPGAFRLSSVLEDETRWRETTILGLRHRLVAGGSGSFFGAQPEVLVDGLPVGPDMFGAAVLDRLPLAMADVQCVAAGPGSELVGGRLDGPGALRVVLRPPAEGLTVGGGAVLGNEEGDAGLWAFSDRASINVDKAFGAMDAHLAVRRGAGWLRAGVGPRYVYPTDPAIRGRTEPRFGEGALVRLWVRPAWVRGHWSHGSLRVDAAAGASVMNDLVHEPRLGTESLDSTGHAHAALSVRGGVGGLRLDAGGSWSRNRLFGPRNSGSPLPPVALQFRRVHAGAALGDTSGVHGDVAAGWDAVRRDGPGLRGGPDRFWGRVGLGWTVPGVASTRLDAQVARDGGRTIPAGRARLALPVGWVSSAFLDLATTGSGPVDDRSLLGLGQARRFDAARLDGAIDGAGPVVDAWTPPADRLWALDVGLERRGGLAVGAALRHHVGAARVDRARGFDPASRSFPSRVGSAPSVDATLGSVWARGAGAVGPVRLEASVDVPTLLSGSPGAEALFGPSTAAAAVARAAWAADPRLDLWWRVRARRGASWPEFAGIGAATAGAWSEEVGPWAALDLGAALRLARGALLLDLAVRNLTDARIASHPIGLREDRGLYVRGAFRWAVLAGR